jgi:hypothetical protein
VSQLTPVLRLKPLLQLSGGNVLLSFPSRSAEPLSDEGIIGRPVAIP